jgi:Flp pilus assembly protein TadD
MDRTPAVPPADAAVADFAQIDTLATSPRLNGRDWLIAIALFLLTWAGFQLALKCDFVNFDDSGYITTNFRVMQGLTWENVKWAFTTDQMSNWHPITWLSYLLDVSIFGYGPFGMHCTNVLFHALNAGLVYLVLRRMTGSVWKSAIVALIWMIHPLRVESVAWVSERKDVLSLFFGLLALWVYTSHAQRPRGWRLVLICFWFALSLMCKPMLVTLPALLMLLDVWPLGRITRWHTVADWKRIGWLALEKAPLWALAIASSLITMKVQENAIGSTEDWSLSLRVSGTFIAYSWYVVKLFHPLNLSILYYWSFDWPHWQTMASIVFIIIATWVLVREGLRRPYLAVGWLWFLGTLVPVIGIVQIGHHRYADRYSYFPHLGLLIAVVWGAHEVLRRAKVQPKLVGVVLAVGVTVLGLVTRIQCGFWGNSIILFTHAADVDPNNPTAWINLGEEWSSRGYYEAAEAHFQRALEIDPENYYAFNNLGVIATRGGDFARGARLFMGASRIRPNSATARANLGSALMEMGRFEYAKRAFHHALGLDPELASPYNNLGILSAMEGDEQTALTYNQEALRLAPRNAVFHLARVRILAYFGHLEEARAATAGALAFAKNRELMEADIAKTFASPSEMLFQHHGDPTTRPATQPATQPETAPATQAVETP